MYNNVNGACPAAASVINQIVAMQLDLPYVSGQEYLQGSIATGVRIGTHIYPLAVQPEFFPNEGILYQTSRLVLLLAHPDYGNIQFYMRFVGNAWRLDPPDYTDQPSPNHRDHFLWYSFHLSDEIIEDIINALEVPVTLDYSESVNYTTHSFLTSLQLDGAQCPALFQTEFLSIEGILHATPRMMVLLLHPDYGNIIFVLRSVVLDDQLDHRWLLDTPEFRDEPWNDSETIAARYSFVLSKPILELCEQVIRAAHL